MILHRRYSSLVSAMIELICGSLLLMSCINTRKSTYFNDLSDSRISSTRPVPESFIVKNDILSIQVTSLSADDAALYNMPNATMVPNGGVLTGYLVDADGNIQFPVLGAVKAAGLTKDQLKTAITSSLLAKKLLRDPIVSIRHQNFRITVLGEVKSPLVITVPNEKISLLEALGLAGDLTIYAKRDNVLVIREEDGEKVILSKYHSPG